VGKDGCAIVTHNRIPQKPLRGKRVLNIVVELPIVNRVSEVAFSHWLRCRCSQAKVESSQIRHGAGKLSPDLHPVRLCIEA
jgi:hypothetical protein